jgi:hypothetical protein
MFNVDFGHYLREVIFNVDFGHCLREVIFNVAFRHCLMEAIFNVHGVSGLDCFRGFRQSHQNVRLVP